MMAEESKTPDLSTDYRRETAEGLLYTHSRLNANTQKTLEAASFLYALIELLSEKGQIAVDELDERKKVVGERLVRQFREQGLGALFQEPEYDKYAFEHGAEIDCAARVHLCKAACCRLPFALSKQDLHEGVVRWELGQPYMIEQGSDGYCTHLDRCSNACTIHAQRPAPCRGYDCREDDRVWLDFAAMVSNPAIERADWPTCFETKREEGVEEGTQ